MNKSFTLIEILIVIVVIGILSAFILVGMSSITGSANIAKGKAFLNSMDSALLLGRVSQWKFDEAVGSTTVYDSWGTNTGTLLGAAPLAQFQTTGCISNNCLSFDGTDDYINCGTGVAIGMNSFTFSFWAKTSNNATQYVLRRNASAITGWRGRYYFPNTSATNALFYVTTDTYSNGEIFRYMNPSNNSSNTVDGRWHQVVGVCDRTKHAPPDVYLDGVLANGSGAGYCDQLTDNIPADNFYIGGTSYFNGLIDDVRVYNQAIPTSEIQHNYFVGINKLLVNSGINLSEFSQRIIELKSNTANNE